MNNQDKLIESYVLEKFFISTVYSKHAAINDPPVWVYKTSVFVWDKERRKTGNLLHVFTSGTKERNAFVAHNDICLKVFTSFMGKKNKT